MSSFFAQRVGHNFHDWTCVGTDHRIDVQGFIGP